MPIKTLPSLSSTDMWHLTKGFIAGDSLRATEASLYSYKNGPIGYFSCNLRELNIK